MIKKKIGSMFLLVALIAMLTMGNLLTPALAWETMNNICYIDCFADDEEFDKDNASISVYYGTSDKIKSYYRFNQIDLSFIDYFVESSIKKFEINEFYSGDYNAYKEFVEDPVIMSCSAKEQVTGEDKTFYTYSERIAIPAYFFRGKQGSISIAISEYTSVNRDGTEKENAERNTVVSTHFSYEVKGDKVIISTGDASKIVYIGK